MKIVLLHGDTQTCYTGRLSRKRFEVRSATPKPRRGSLLAVPFSDYRIVSSALPKLAKGEREKAVKLQLAFHFTDKAYLTGHRFVTDDRGDLLFMHGAKVSSKGMYSAALPDLLGLFCIADRFGFIGSGQGVVVYTGKGDAACVAVNNGRPVFIRQFVPTDLVREIRLSAQDRYESREVKNLQLDYVVLISENNSDEQLLNESLPCPVHRIVPQQVMSAPENGSEKAALCVSGLASYRFSRKKLKGWNLLEGQTDPKRALMRGLLFTFPLWILFLYLMMYAENRDLREKLAGVEGKMRAIAPRYREVAELEYQVTAMQTFMDEAGSLLKKNREMTDLIHRLETSGGSQVKVTSLSGVAGGVMVVAGRAESFESLSGYLGGIKKYQGITDVKLISSERSEEAQIDFQISLRTGEDETTETK